MYKDVAQNLDLFEVKYPKTLVPKPTKDDYSNGFIRRYFLRKTNDVNGHVFEVSKDTYEEYKDNAFWVGDTMKWRISGPREQVFDKNGDISDRGVISSNKSAIGMVARKIRNIGLYLPNHEQFYK